MRWMKPSRSMVVALMALLVALSGSAVAAFRLPANSVGTREVVNHSLLKKDFKAGQLPRGPRGLPGEQGAQGQEGAQGPRGPSSAYYGVALSPQVLQVPDDYGPVARIYLPVGSFVVFASASFQNRGADLALVSCFIGRAPDAQESTERRATLAGYQAGFYPSAAIAMQIIVGQTATGYHYLECKDYGAQDVYVVSVPQSEMTAIQVDGLSPGVAP